MAHTVGVVGASGYGGAELVRLLAGHPALDLTVVAAHRQAGTPVRALFPNLDTDARFEPVDIDRLEGLDLVFLATPHGAAAELGAALSGSGTRVVDLSAAFRLAPDDYANWYGETHVHPDLTPAVYGLTEWARDVVRGATLVANPGCYPTAALLALVPLARLIRPGSVVVDAKSGTSGAGRGQRDDLQFSHVHGDVAAYGAPRHRHTIELERWLTTLSGTATGSVTFTPHLIPSTRGLLATCYADLHEEVAADDVTGALHDRYAREPFVRVLPPATFPHTKALCGSNGCQLAAVVDDRTHRVVVASAIDNLGKGAAGQALQNANLMLGLDETLGLSANGVYP
ncbi:MAG TPA: N-acetyl-gamma-glutamyl-phosphate reductase [Nitriliruptorales bacterium]|nr:N-acetyl-gamma-glutamyl-phosphate reductase [Nitriliruptorales bacterium]